jgi:hypothetical protein
MKETTKKVMIDHEMKTADKARAATTPEVAAKRGDTRIGKKCQIRAFDLNRKSMRLRARYIAMKIISVSLI